MKPFTDKDLKRLKAYVDGDIELEIGPGDLAPLLARLEAAENLIELRGIVIQMERNTRKIETAAWAWRKSAGK